MTPTAIVLGGLTIVAGTPGGGILLICLGVGYWLLLLSTIAWTARRLRTAERLYITRTERATAVMRLSRTERPGIWKGSEGMAYPRGTGAGTELSNFVMAQLQANGERLVASARWTVAKRYIARGMVPLTPQPGCPGCDCRRRS